MHALRERPARGQTSLEERVGLARLRARFFVFPGSRTKVGVGGWPEFGAEVFLLSLQKR